MLRGVFLLSFFLPLLAFARVDLLEWRPEKYDYSFVIPRVEGESSQTALARYLATLESNPELAPFATELRKAKTKSLQEFHPGDKGPFVLALANDPLDLEPTPARMHEVLGPLTKRGSRPLIAPVAVTAGLNDVDAQDFRQKVSAQFDGLVAVGGDDIHPSLFGDKDPKKLSVDTNLSRDREEMKLVRSYLDEGRGFFTGICRGHQMGGVASGCALVKDIREELNINHARNVDHDIVPHQAGLLTQKVFDSNDSISVMSYHHQSVVIPKESNPRLRVTAVVKGQKELAEISEYYGKRGLSVQTHPELMHKDSFSRRYYDLVHNETELAYARRTKRPFKHIDQKKTLFGIEYTFQDQEIVNEPGRLTWETPHKRARFEAITSAYRQALGVGTDAVSSVGDPTFKPGVSIAIPGDGNHVFTMEPVTIETATPPRAFEDIRASAVPIYEAARAAKLVPYVNPAAERSGMGHIHVGAKTIGESPFYKHPHLLRNMMVKMHKHPSLLWGFAEAYDIDNVKIRASGSNTNIETYHRARHQEAFARAVRNFDDWYLKKLKAGEDLSDGLRQYLRFLKAEETGTINFFDHYRYINLEHLEWIAESNKPIDPRTTGRHTAEFRNFRPPKSPAHGEANAELLLSLMDEQAKPGHLEKFVRFSADEYDLFHSATRAAADWELVKRELPRHNPLWDDTVGEYVLVQLGQLPHNGPVAGAGMAEVFPAYAPKKLKGTKFEIRLPATNETPPSLTLGKKSVSFERVQVDGYEFWVGVISESQRDELVKQKGWAQARQLRVGCAPSFARLNAPAVP